MAARGAGGKATGLLARLLQLLRQPNRQSSAWPPPLPGASEDLHQAPCDPAARRRHHDWVRNCELDMLRERLRRAPTRAADTAFAPTRIDPRATDRAAGPRPG